MSFCLIVVLISSLFLLNACGNTDSSNTLVMATNAEFPPFEFWQNDEIVGIDVDFARAIANKLGYELKVQDMDFNAIIPAIKSGKADFGGAAISVTEERQKEVDFSDSYFTGVQVVIVQENSSIQKPEDMKGKVIGVITGFTGDFFVTADFGEDSVQRFNRGVEAVQSLSQGKIDAVVIDDQAAAEFVKAVTGLRILDTNYVEEDYSFAFQKGSNLVARFNQAIQELKADGTFDQIIQKYIPRN